MAPKNNSELEHSRWLNLTPVVKCRQKLRTWSRSDVLALSMKIFGTVALDKGQIAVLLKGLKIAKLPEPQWYRGLPEEGDVAPGELTWFDNGVPDSAGTDSVFDLGAGSLFLKFKDAAAVTEWALTLIEADPRKTWDELLRKWKSWTRLSGFKAPAGFPAYDFTPAAAKALKRARIQDTIARTPLPDNGDLKKKYWGLEPGDVLTHPTEPSLIVASVRLNMGSAPTISFKKVESTL